MSQVSKNYSNTSWLLDADLPNTLDAESQNVNQFTLFYPSTFPFIVGLKQTPKTNTKKIKRVK